MCMQSEMNESDRSQTELRRTSERSSKKATEIQIKEHNKLKSPPHNWAYILDILKFTYYYN